MSNEPEVTAPEVTPSEGGEKEAVQYTSAEQEAMPQGWVPLEQWKEQGKDPDDWVTARQFIRNGELFGRINSYKHKIIGLEKSVKALVDHNEKLFDAGYKQAQADLKAQKRAALENDDHDAVMQIDEQLEELRETHEEQKQKFKETVDTAPPQQHPAWEPWVEQNQWYAKNAMLRGAADTIGRQLVSEAQAAGKPVDFGLLLTEITRKMKEEFPDKFTSPKPESGQRRADGSSRKVARDDDLELDSTEREIMETLIRSGAVTREKYIADLKKIKKASRS